MKEPLNSSETSVITRATRRNIPEDSILHSHHRENLKSYIKRMGWFRTMSSAYDAAMEVRILEVSSTRRAYVSCVTLERTNAPDEVTVHRYLPCLPWCIPWRLCRTKRHTPWWLYAGQRGTRRDDCMPDREEHTVMTLCGPERHITLRFYAGQRGIFRDDYAGQRGILRDGSMRAREAYSVMTLCGPERHITWRLYAGQRGIFRDDSVQDREAYSVMTLCSTERHITWRLYAGQRGILRDGSMQDREAYSVMTLCGTQKHIPWWLKRVPAAPECRQMIIFVTYAVLNRCLWGVTQCSLAAGCRMYCSHLHFMK
jgi:hypothetical protein